MKVSTAQRRLQKLNVSWTCFNCDYFGERCNEDEDGNEACPRCGTICGDGFGMAMNDPRYYREIARLRVIIEEPEKH